MSNCSGLVFNIQRFLSMTVRESATVFLNGCPMRCRWCGNLNPTAEGRNCFIIRKMYRLRILCGSLREKRGKC